MKQFLLFSFLVALTSMSLNAQIYYMSNGDMEQWTNYTTYDHPNGWDSPNVEMAAFSAGSVVSKSTDANSGTYSAKIETKTVFSMYTVPGVLVHGTFTANIAAGTLEISGGDTCTVRPATFKGFYKYTPAGGDSCIIAAGIFKRNTVSGLRDTIAYATFYQSGTVSAWTEFQVDFDYNSSETPDSLLVVASASNQTAPVAGSVLYVDDFSFEGTVVGIKPVYSESASVYLDQANNKIIISNIPESKKGNSITVFNSLGVAVYKVKLSNSSMIKIDASAFIKGLYIVELVSDSKRTVQKVIIN